MWDLAVREEDYKAVDAMLQRYSGAPLSFRALPLFARHDSAGMIELSPKRDRAEGEKNEGDVRIHETREDLLLQRHAGAKLTFTGSRWSVSKNSRSWKPKGRATISAGKVCCTLLNR